MVKEYRGMFRSGRVALLLLERRDEFVDRQRKSGKETGNGGVAQGKECVRKAAPRCGEEGSAGRQACGRDI